MYSTKDRAAIFQMLAQCGEGTGGLADLVSQPSAFTHMRAAWHDNAEQKRRPGASHGTERVQGPSACTEQVACLRGGAGPGAALGRWGLRAQGRQRDQKGERGGARGAAGHAALAADRQDVPSQHVDRRVVGDVRLRAAHFSCQNIFLTGLCNIPLPTLRPRKLAWITRHDGWGSNPPCTQPTHTSITAVG